ncbi:MAG: hypothetical protein JNL36_01030 [Candidatus Kapabacteria bacterium]|nr:hypothetical protein [Candidatus Kapabacteria bacterium]
MKISLFNIILLFVTVSFSYAQDNQSAASNKAIERIQQIRKVKLIEVLDLDDNTADKFFLKDHQNSKKIDIIRQEIDNLSAELERSLRDGQQTDIRKKSDQMFTKMTEFMNLNVERLKTAKQLLPEEKFAKFMVFETKFRREIEMFLIRKEGRMEKRNFQKR